MSFPLKPYLEQKRRVVESALREVFRKPGDCPKALWNSMKYSVFAGGKRLRPILCLASAEAVGLTPKAALRVACALELIHTYSLIHDDLPALDDDDYRRGRKTNHKVFGEAMAILAGDGLQTLAFEWVSSPAAYPAPLRKNLPLVTHELAHFAGYPGMVGGQVDDVLSERKKPVLSKVHSIHRRKTGALLLSSVRLPALLAGVSRQKREALTEYGRCAGLAFQIVDDILNETGDSGKLGKKAGSDRARGKMTYPAAIGLEKSKGDVRRLTGQAVDALGVFGKKGEPLKALALYMAERTN
ncbi:MAG TPA: farnesyl diphosphate synthase [bacterium]|nr:farnesyl diphosphate synthase [bacterium]